MLLLTGCGKSRELENRDFVMAIAIDRGDEISVSTAVAKLTDEEEKNEEVIFEGKGSTIEEAVADINNSTKGNLYMGHSRVIVLSNDFDDYKSLIDFFGKNIEMSRDIVIVRANNPSKIIAAKNNDEPASEYIFDYYKNKKGLDMDSLMNYYNKGYKIVVPGVTIENENIVAG